MSDNEEQTVDVEFHKSLKITSWILSIVFHPMFILCYGYILLALYNPYVFGEVHFSAVFAIGSSGMKGIWFLNTALFSCLIPLFGIALMRALGLIPSIQLKSSEDRKLPYIITCMFYISLVASNGYNPSLPIEIKAFALGACISLFIAFFINLFSKISLHAVGMGGLMAMVIIIFTLSYVGPNYLVILTILLSGAVGTSRLILHAHQPNDVYGGYAVGFLPQFIALDYFL